MSLLDGRVQPHIQRPTDRLGQGQHRRHSDHPHQLEGTGDVRFIDILVPVPALAFVFGRRRGHCPWMESGQLARTLHGMGGQAGIPADDLSAVIEPADAGVA